MEAVRRVYLWPNDDCAEWRRALDNYPLVIDAQGSKRLAELDVWYREELPATIRSREEPHITLDELRSVTSWKMTRGEWRERNRWLVAGNDPEEVAALTRRAFAEAPDPRKPLATISLLSGVGPATASAVMAAYMPEVYPFFDEPMSSQVPGLGPVAYTLKYYVAYAEAIREQASRLTEICGSEWTPQDVAQALWSASGGKAGV